MRHSPFVLLAPLLLLLLAGCVPRERFWWSPDGSRAAVVLDRRLHLVDGNGDLIGELSSEAGDAEEEVWTESAAWLPGGDGLVVHRIRLHGDWSAAREALPEERARRVEQLSREMPALLSAAVVLGGDAANAGALLERLEGESRMLMAFAFRRALERDSDAIREALAGAPEARSKLDADDGIDGYPVHELAVIRLGESTPAKDANTTVLVRSMEPLVSPCVSPGHPVVAYGRQRSADRLVSLSLVSLEGEVHDPGLHGIRDAFEWTPDGRSLAFLAPLSEDEGLLQRVMTVELLGAAGEWRTGSVDERTANLATAVVPFSPCLEVLPNEEILFASQSGRLPTANADSSYRAHLYRVSVEGGDIWRVPTAEGALPMDLGHFVASPDGSRVAVVESESDAVAVVELDTGRTEIISPSHARWKCRTLPAWRNGADLSFAALDEEAETVQWKLRSDGGRVTVLSDGWPANGTEGWLVHRDSNRAVGGPNATPNDGSAN